MEILIVTSFFAAVLAFHNACARYLFSLGRERLLPTLARTHHRMSSPHIASLALTVISIIAIGAGALLGADPFLGIGLWSYAIGVAGLAVRPGRRGGLRDRLLLEGPPRLRLLARGRGAASSAPWDSSARSA